MTKEQEKKAPGMKRSSTRGQLNSCERGAVCGRPAYTGGLACTVHWTAWLRSEPQKQGCFHAPQCRLPVLPLLPCPSCPLQTRRGTARCTEPPVPDGSIVLPNVLRTQSYNGAPVPL